MTILKDYLPKARHALKFCVASTLAAGMSMSASAAPESSDPIKLALNEWTGQHLTTYIAGEVLQRAGYNVEYVTAGYIPQFIALQNGSVTATLEIWESSIGDAPAKAVATGKVEDLGSVGLQPIEGWYYPDYVADLCPGLPDYKALNECAAKFATAETIPKGRMIDYPADWESGNDKRIKAMGLDFQILNAGSEGALIAELKAASLTKQPYVMMFWRPHWVHSAYPGGWVEFPANEPGCMDDPKWGENPNEVYDCGFANSWINKFTWSGTKDKWPGAYEILKSYQLENDQQEALMKAVDVDGEEELAVAKAWVDNNKDTWQVWIN